jgi:hypothetical protein
VLVRLPSENVVDGLLGLHLHAAKPSATITRNAKDPTQAKVVRSFFTWDKSLVSFPVAVPITGGGAVLEGLVPVEDR